VDRTAKLKSDNIYIYMRARGNVITEKYKALRLHPDSLYGSRLVQTFFNKFIQKGQKAFSRKQAFSALIYYRMSFRRPQLFFALLRLFQRLRAQFTLVHRRQGNIYIAIPVPVRRNKRDVLNLQLLYYAISNRRERSVWERIYQELTACAHQPRQAPAFRTLSAHLYRVYGEQIHEDRR
jgi:ribosomal protein S7